MQMYSMEELMIDKLFIYHKIKIMWFTAQTIPGSECVRGVRKVVIL